jgi:dephospho-CoA kinase
MQKGIKYKINYIQNGGSSTKKEENNYILLDGTSSSGKSTICNFFSTKGFKCIKGDELLEGPAYYSFYGQEYKKIPNEYVTEEFKKNIGKNISGKYFLENAIKNDKTIIDWVVPQGIINNFQERKISLYVILVYAGLSTLARNMVSRKAENDPRRTFVFRQFSERYIKTTDKEKIIDTINRKTLKKILLDNFKMEFTGEKDLTDFCNKTFKTMNIEDDEDNGIKVRDEFKYNYLLNTNDKSKVDIIQELEVLFATL